MVLDYFSYPLFVVHSCVCVSRVLKIYRNFELRFGVKPELESVRIKAGIKIGVESRL